MKIFEYYINLDERGEFSADVRNFKGKTIFSITSVFCSADEIEDMLYGYMRHKNDIEGLRKYLISSKLIKESDKLIKGN